MTNTSSAQTSVRFASVGAHFVHGCFAFSKAASSFVSPGLVDCVMQDAKEAHHDGLKAGVAYYAGVLTGTAVAVGITAVGVKMFHP